MHNFSTVGIVYFVVFIAIRAAIVNKTAELPSDNIILPQQEDIGNLSSTEIPVQIEIPPALLTERLNQENQSQSNFRL